MPDPIRPAGGSRLTVPAAAVPPLDTRIFTGGAFVSPVRFTVSGARPDDPPLSISFARTPRGIDSAVTVDGSRQRGGIMEIGLGTPPPPADLKADLRGRAFDATVADSYGLRPISDGDNRSKLAKLLTDPAIASQRTAFLSTTSSPATVVLPATAHPSD